MPVNDHQPNDQQPPQTPPAVRVPLRGNYLIEASAGTGKTWTLTGIVLRLLIEAKRAPEHIIATTFTRAAWLAQAWVSDLARCPIGHGGYLAQQIRPRQMAAQGGA